MHSLTLIIALVVATAPAQPTPASTPATPVEETTPGAHSPPALPGSVPDHEPPPVTVAPDAKAPEEPTTSPLSPLTVQTQDGPRIVDLDDEASWEGLSSPTKDKLRAERARRQAKARASTEPAQPAPDLPGRDPELAPTRSAPATRHSGELQGYYKDKERQLVITTAVLGGLWGVLTLTSIGLVSSGRGTPALNGAIGIFTAASGLGTIVSGTLLGAHRNTRPLYFTAGRGGIGLRF